MNLGVTFLLGGAVAGFIILLALAVYAILKRPGQYRVYVMKEGMPVWDFLYPGIPEVGDVLDGMKITDVIVSGRVAAVEVEDIVNG